MPYDFLAGFTHAIIRTAPLDYSRRYGIYAYVDLCVGNDDHCVRLIPYRRLNRNTYGAQSPVVITQGTTVGAPAFYGDLGTQVICKALRFIYKLKEAGYRYEPGRKYRVSVGGKVEELPVAPKVTAA